MRWQRRSRQVAGQGWENRRHLQQIDGGSHAFKRRLFQTFVVCILTCCAISAQTGGKGGGTRVRRSATRFDGVDIITYHNGPVMFANKHLYYIWYGNWNNNNAPNILTDFAQTLGGSPYFKIDSTYGDSAGRVVNNTLTFNGSANDNYS